jgi:hypothetical protein
MWWVNELVRSEEVSEGKLKGEGRGRVTQTHVSLLETCRFDSIAIHRFNKSEI